MNKKIVITIVCCALIILIAIGYKFRITTKHVPDQPIQKQMPQNTNDVSVIFGGEGEYICDVIVKNVPAEYINQTIKLYAKKNMFRFEESPIVNNLGELGLSVSVIKNGYNYSWYPQGQTTKVKINPGEEVATIVGGKIKDKIAYNCLWSDISDEMFNIRGSEIFDTFANQLLLSDWTRRQDVESGYSFSFPSSIPIAATNDPSFNTYTMSGSAPGDMLYNFNITTTPKNGHFQFESESPISFTTSAAEQYKSAMSVENSKSFSPESNLDSEYKVLNDTIVQVSNIGNNVRVHSTFDERFGSYKTTYFFENEKYVFVVSVNGPSEKVNLIAEKIVNSFK